jgi:organic hydroperoxide reductase OsmC/OhrA
MEGATRLVLTGGPSPELAGDVNARSAEHMLLSSLGLSMLTTFEAFAARDRIGVLGWDAKVSGTVEQTPEGRMFTSIVLELDIELEGNLDRLETTLEDTKQCCLVLNSMRVPVVIETTVRTPDEIVDDVPHSYDLRQLAPRDSRREASRWDSLEQRQAS